jgi:exportin-1
MSHYQDTSSKLQEFAGEDNEDLFLEERETAIKSAQDEKRKQQLSVPGIIGPHEIPEEMQD